MNSGVDFAAGGIVLLEQKILIVKNKRGDSPEDGLSWWGYPIGSSGVLIVPEARSFRPKNGSTSSFSLIE